MKLTQWIPADDSPRWICWESFANLELPRGTQRKFIRSFSGNRKELIEWNQIVKDFLDRGDDWLFSTHNDVVYDRRTLKRLLSWEKPLISALIFMRQSPVVPHIWKSNEDNGRMAQRIQNTRDWFFDHRESIAYGPHVMDPRPANALVEVDFTSTACTLIHRSVLAAIEPPWFEMHADHAGGEDANFFAKAHGKGFHGFVDRSCVAGHLVGDIPTGAMDFMMWTQASEYVNTGEPGVPDTREELEERQSGSLSG